MVTLTIGGDDMGFSGIMETCAALSLTDLFGDPCQRHYTAGGTDLLAAAINATAPKVAAVLQGIHARAPLARVLLVGYPDILPSTGDGCLPVVPLAFGDVPYLRGLEIQPQPDAGAHRGGERRDVRRRLRGDHRPRRLPEPRGQGRRGADPDLAGLPVPPEPAR